MTAVTKTLRRAAALMRERAEAATSGPWHVAFIDGRLPCVVAPGGLVAESGTPGKADMEHAASWHPLVAKAFAVLLDEAARCECGEIHR